MEHVPAASGVTWVPERLQIEDVPFTCKVNVRPELAEADKLWGLSVATMLFGVRKVIVWERPKTEKVCVTLFAARY